MDNFWNNFSPLFQEQIDHISRKKKMQPKKHFFVVKSIPIQMVPSV